VNVELRIQAFDPWLEAQQAQARIAHRHARVGATSIFIGTMRDFNDGETVSAMQLEHYPGMTERQLEKILAEVSAAHTFIDALVIHRVGAIAPGDPIVLVAVWAEHRGSAFGACREIIEALKSRAPFWKKETRSDGERWVECNTPG
jgi:molybdopterin synthase catalytic subunit